MYCLFIYINNLLYIYLFTTLPGKKNTILEGPNYRPALSIENCSGDFKLLELIKNE